MMKCSQSLELEGRIYPCELTKHMGAKLMRWHLCYPRENITIRWQA